ncbi:MAG TPA: hypothetical protein VG738_22470 [Chitinophagaceae bacterium]|nr:hypothetical protein [Chitinophagaceae bacterium]
MQKYLLIYKRIAVLHALAVLAAPGYAQLTVKGGTTVHLTGSVILNAGGNIASNGTFYGISGSLMLNGTSAQTISGNPIYINNVTVNNNAGVTIAAGDTLKVYGVYTPAAGVLAADGYLLLASNAAGTASVAQGAGTYVTGNAIVQRYIPGRRAWRLLTAPLSNTGSIFSNWENNGVVTDTSGVEIWSPTGTGSSGNGIAKGGAAASAEYYDPAVNNSSGGAWIGISNTMSTLLSGTVGSAANNAYAVFVTGPYGSGRIKTATGDTSTTLMATGQLQTGAQVFTYNNIPSGNYIMVGNPYASPVDFTQVGARGAATGNINNTMWVWDAQRTGTSLGGYVMFSYDAATGTYDQDIDASQTKQTSVIQSGQAFFVQAVSNAQPAIITFDESDKVSASNATNDVFFAPQPNAGQQLRVVLNHNGTPEDEVLLKFGSVYSKSLTDDGAKLFDYDENLSIRVDTSYLGIERMPLPEIADTIYLDVYAMKAKQNYSFSFMPFNMPFSTLHAWLIDKYLNNITPVGLTGSNTISFATGADTASYDEKRFVMVFSKNDILATAVTIQAMQQGKGVRVEWTATSEEGVKQYLVEKSTDGQNFAFAGTPFPARNSGITEVYTAIDNLPAAGSNYYRVKIYNKDGTSGYTKIVEVKIDNSRNVVTVYPNPALHGQQVNVLLNNVAPGKYQLMLFSNDGRKVLEKSLKVDGYSAMLPLTLSNDIAAGAYRVVLQDGKGNSWARQIIVN